MMSSDREDATSVHFLCRGACWSWSWPWPWPWSLTDGEVGSSGAPAPTGPTSRLTLGVTAPIVFFPSREPDRGSDSVTPTLRQNLLRGHVVDPAAVRRLQTGHVKHGHDLAEAESLLL